MGFGIRPVSSNQLVLSSVSFMALGKILISLSLSFLSCEVGLISLTIGEQL